MKYLIDTHILLWYVGDSKRLSEETKNVLIDRANKIYYSTVSVWELAIKRIKKPDRVPDISPQELTSLCYEAGLEELTLKIEHVYMLETLSRPKDVPPHSDPFDRILISQAKSENMIFLTHDPLLPYYNEDCIVYV